MSFENDVLQILFNVSLQVVNLIIFFFLFKYFFADKIISAINERKELMNKLKNADEEYENIIESANKKYEELVEQASKHKESILAEANQLAEKEKEKIISSANKKAEDIVNNAQIESEKIKKDLENNWEQSVKDTTKTVLTKLFDRNVDFQDEYIKKLIQEFNK